MAPAATPTHIQGQAENGDESTEKVQSKRSSRRLSGLLNRRKSQKAEGDKDSENPVKKDLEVPLYRRYASFRSRTPSARGGSTTPKSTGKEGMTSTTDIETKDVAQGEGVEQNASPDQSKNPENFPTTSEGKVEKPLPIPKDMPKRPRRISVKVSKILNSLPSPGKQKDERVDSDAKAGNEGTSRSRLLERVGNIVNRKPKLHSETNTEEGTNVQGGAVESKQEAVLEDGVAPDVPAKTEGVTEEKREAAHLAEQPKPQEPCDPALKSTKPPPPSSANRASRLARRLSSGALDAVRRSRSRSRAGTKGVAKADVPLASHAGLVGQDLTPQAIQSEKPAVEAGESTATATATNATSNPRSSAEDKILPAPPTEDASSPKTKEKAPPTAFKDAARVARRLSNGASGIFKRPNASSPELSDSNKAAATETRSVNEGPNASTTEKATELVRRISTRAQNTIAKARASAKAKNEGAQKPAPAAEAVPVSSPHKEQSSVAEVEPTAASVEAVEAVAEPQQAVVPVEAQVPPPPETEQPAAATSDRPEELSESPEDAVAAQEVSPITPSAELEQPDKDLPPPPSAFSLGGFTRRLSSGVSGVFGYGAAVEDVPANEGAQSSTSSVDQLAAESTTAKDDQEPEPAVAPIPVVAEVVEVSIASEGAIAPPPAEEVPETKEQAALPEAAAVDGETVSPAEGGARRPTLKRAATSDKNLPSPPPPSAAESIAKIGKLTRRLSNRVSTSVGSAIKSAATSPKVQSPSVEKQVGTQIVSGKEGVEDVGTSEGEQAPGPVPISEDLNASSHAAPKVDALSVPPATTSSTPPPGAFKSSKPKLGRRLSARIGDVFRSKAPPVPDKEALKDDMMVDGEPLQAKDVEPASESTAAVDHVKEDGEKEAAPVVDTQSAPVAAEPADSSKQDGHDEEPIAPAVDHEATPTAEIQAEDTPEKPLPSKPSRSSRARDVAVDVGRQLSIRASGALKATRPKLEEIVSRTPSAFKSSDKGKKREKENVEDDWEKVEAQGGVSSVGIAPESKSPAEEGARDSVGLTGGLDQPNVASSEDVKGASVEAVEGGTLETAPKESIIPVTKDESPKQDAAKLGRSALSSRVTGIFKVKHKPVERPVQSNEADLEDKQTTGAALNGKGEKRRRRIDLGSRFGTKKSEKGGAVQREVNQGSISDISLPPPAVPPKDEGEDNKPPPLAKDEATASQSDSLAPAASTKEEQDPQVGQAAQPPSAPILSA